MQNANSLHTDSLNARVLLEVNDLKVHFDLPKPILSRGPAQTVKAVDGVSFSVRRGETLGVVGESGCGKSTTGLAVLRMAPIRAGSVILDGQDITTLKGEPLRRLRRKMQMVYQDPFGALDPRMRVLDIIGEPLLVHKLVENKAAYRKEVLELMDLVGLNPKMAERYPHEFSGGQRQRIGIARALAARPELIICDEPVSALDVSIQAQIINLLEDLQKKLGLTYLFIAHDLAVVRHICDRVMVMYLGHVVEVADSHELYRNPQHPYTQALLSAIPVPDPRHRSAEPMLEGEVPSPVNPPAGCPFHPRCKQATAACAQQAPTLTATGERHAVACHLYEPADSVPEGRVAAQV
jgi:oligopeptide transport system ATP-binding protein